jgi:hypothetical protein
LRLGSRKWIADVLIVSVLWLVAFTVAASYMRMFNRIGGVGEFGQLEYSAAVSLACGHGYGNLGYAATPELARFLTRDVDRFSCSDLPPAIAPGELNITQRLYRYLMSVVGFVWMARGVSWAALWPLFAVLFACTIASAYGLFRLGAGRLLSVAAALALVVSAIHLGHLPYLRDYAKAPFMLALILLMARMAIGPVTTRRTVGYAVAFGIILGVGFGFRNDLLINVPAFVIVVLLCLPGSLRANLRVKGLALGLAALAFVAVAWPIVRGYGAGSNTGHVAVLGLMTPHDQTLGIRASFYDWGYAYVDQYAAAVINSYSYRVNGRSVEYLSNEYDRAAVSWLLRIVRHWPADFVARVYSAVVHTLEMPFTVGTYAYSIPYGVTGRWASALYAWQIQLLQYMTGRGLLVTVLALMIVAVRSMWTAVALLLFLLYYAGYPAIQFGARHFFHLEFVGWWALAYVLQQTVSLVWFAVREAAAGRSVLQPAMYARPLARMAVFVMVAAAVVVGSLATLRAYQTPHVRAMLRGYEAAPRQRLPTTVATGSEKVLIASPGLWSLSPREDPSMPVRVRYLVAEFAAGPACDAVRLPVTFRYRYHDKTSDFSREMILKLSRHGEATRVFFPAYHDENWWSAEISLAAYFDGIELPLGYDGCLTGLSRSTDLERYPLLLDLTLVPRWEEATPFQTIAAFENPNTADGPAFYTAPRDLVVTRAAFDDGFRPAGEAIERSPVVTNARDGGWIVKGRALVPRSPILRFKPRSVTREDVLIVEGELRTGAVSFVLLAAGHRQAAVTVRDAGPFVVALAVPVDGDLEVAIANDIADWWPANRIGRRVGPFAGWIPGATLRTDLVLRRVGWWTRGDARIQPTTPQPQPSVTEE